MDVGTGPSIPNRVKEFSRRCSEKYHEWQRARRSTQIAKEARAPVILSQMIHISRATGWYLLAFLFVQGCAAEHVISVRPSPMEGNRVLLLPPQKGMLLVQAVGERQGTLWYKTAFRSWVLERDPAAIVLQAVEEELKLMGISVTADPSQAGPRLEIELRWFGPYGHSPLTAAVIVAFALYSADSGRPVWRGRVQAGEALYRERVGTEDEDAVIGKVISKVLSDALMQLRWKPDFLEAISHVLQTSMKCSQREEMG
jgi:hypothetical protein